MSETSVQAQFLLPTVISLAFGVLFSTAVTLILVPALYLIGHQWKSTKTNDDNRLPSNQSSMQSNLMTNE